MESSDHCGVYITILKSADLIFKIVIGFEFVLYSCRSQRRLCDLHFARTPNLYHTQEYVISRGQRIIDINDLAGQLVLQKEKKKQIARQNRQFVMLINRIL